MPDTYPNNKALEFSVRKGFGSVVRILHDSWMTGRLLNSWTVEMWVRPARQHAPTRGRHVNLLSFPSRHPAISLSSEGYATASLRLRNGSWYSFEGSTALNDGQWHHVAATWDGTSSILYERELNLYVDGKLEHPGPYDADGFEGPKTPLINGLGVIKCRSVNNTCISSQRALPYSPVANHQCGEANEEGIHIGGIYLCGGAGYAGEYYNGTIDELRIWSRALDLDEITSRMHMPLNSNDQDGLVVYLPMDDLIVLESGAQLMDSKVSLNAYSPVCAAMLGKGSTGQGRPTWTTSSAPLKCAEMSTAPSCYSNSRQQPAGTAWKHGVRRSQPSQPELSLIISLTMPLVCGVIVAYLIFIKRNARKAPGKNISIEILGPQSRS